ncbi:crossover junction endodeoxyribonuclease RuvC [Desulfocurvibacter africanus]|uniref:crossover junction endodeoxyribonuclease RuvC n=1 Tax=Desulfocurvibacter africanus TaxID=873 RepID=UPI002FDB771E
MGETDSGSITVLGLDPGSRRTGWGVVHEASGKLSLVAAGVVATDAKTDLCVRLGRIFTELAKLIHEHRPAEAAVENVFVSQNIMSALKLGQARGAAIAACAHLGLPVNSYEPSLVKKSLVGGGRAEKGQVAFMVGRMLNVRLDDLKLGLDATDALAVAICHLNQRRLTRLTRQAGLAQ